MDAFEQKQLRNGWQHARQQVNNLETQLATLRRQHAVTVATQPPHKHDESARDIAAHERRLIEAQTVQETFEGQLRAAGIPEYEWTRRS